MGPISSNVMELSQDQAAQMAINIEINRPVRQELKQLLNWSLAEIRQIYAPFRKRKGSPLLTRSQFCRFIQLSRISSFYIFDSLAKNTNNDTINIFQIVSILVMASYTSYTYKLQFLFNVFDLECKKRLEYLELILLFKSMARGFCFLTGQALSNDQILDKFAHAMFYKADLNHDQVLQIGQQVFHNYRLIGWMEASPEYLIVLKIFEPPIYGKQQFHIFSFFAQYTNEEVCIMLERIKKTYKRTKLFDEDFQGLKAIPKVRRSYKKSSAKFNISRMTPSKSFSHEHSNQKSTFRISTIHFNKTSLQASPNKNIKSVSRCPAFGKQNKTDYNSFITQNIPSIETRSATNSKFLPNIIPRQSKYSYKKKFDNIIIIKGRSITKKQVFQLREYFDDLAAGKKHIEIEGFIQNFNQEKYSHMKSVAASLFNFLDRKNSGKIQFLDLVTKLYPSLTSQHIKTINRWSDEYNKNFGSDEKEGSEGDVEQMKKRVLPKTCIGRLQELFKFFDTEGKGHVTIENLRQILGRACSEKQIRILFESSDIDKDGKLTLQQFSHVLLPPDLEIEGLKQFKEK